MNQNLSAAPALASASRVRYGVLGFVCTLSMITYLDRVCFGSAAKAIAGHLGYRGTEDIDWAFSAFALSYAIFEIPTGWLGDVFGPRKTLIRIVIWWSFFTVLTGFLGLLTLQAVGGGPWELTISIVGLFSIKVAIGLVILSLIRFLFGMGEAGAYPNLTRAMHNWLPFTERGLGQGAMWMAGRFMGGMTPLVWMVLVGYNVVPWWGAFIIFGLIGAVWCVAFRFWFRDRPGDHPQVNQAEVDLIEKGRLDIGAGHARVPWLRLATSLNLWILCTMYFCAAFAWYFNICM